MSGRMKPCKLCGSIPVIKMRNYNVCFNHLTSFYVICSFCGTESRAYLSVSDAIDDWNEQNGQGRHCA